MSKRTKEIVIGSALGAAAYYVWFINQADQQPDDLTVNKGYQWPVRFIGPNNESSYDSRKFCAESHAAALRMYNAWIEKLKKQVPNNVRVISFRNDSPWVGICT